MDVQVGDTVIRYLSSQKIPMYLLVTEVTNDRIVCGDWEFDRLTGHEIDEFLGWDVGHTGSWITLND